jgi:hypothetical protein
LIEHDEEFKEQYFKEHCEQINNAIEMLHKMTIEAETPNIKKKIPLEKKRKIIHYITPIYDDIIKHDKKMAQKLKNTQIFEEMLRMIFDYVGSIDKIIEYHDQLRASWKK